MKSEKKFSFFRLMRQILKFSWKANPSTFLLLMVCSLSLSVIQVLEIYSLRFLFDSVSNFANGLVNFFEVVKSVIFIGAVLLLGPVAETAQYLS